MNLKKYILLIIILNFLITELYSDLLFKRITSFSPGLDYGGGYILCGDTDNDSLNELIFSNSTNYTSLQVWEYRSTNHYELAWWADGGQPPPPGGILVGNFRPNDIGDIDRDGLTDLVGRNTEYYYNDYFHSLVSTQESPNSSSYPESLSWYQRYSSNAAEAAPFFYTDDLDQDGNDEINFIAQQSGYTYIFENVANDSNELVWCYFHVGAYSFAYDDFDLDGRKEFVTANLGSSGRTSVYENVAPDSYELIYQDTVRRPNGSDVFSGDDLDEDRKPEFFVGFSQAVGSNSYILYLYMWETTGNNSYERTLIDTLSIHNFTSVHRTSKCADIDGDGIEELIWSTLTNLLVYKAVGNNQFQLQWSWINDHATDVDAGRVNVYDMNNNGYNEIIFFGNGKISIFEIETVRLLTPNGGQNFLPGDTVLIQWQKFTPPRCDSFSLSHTTDNGRTYQPILNSIPSTESTYNWIVPNTPSDSCRVKVTAYGPGTQFDESDALFTIQPSGLEEVRVIDQPLRLEINPNPFKTKTIIRLNKPVEKPITFKIYNSSGSLVKTFTLTTNNQQLITLTWDGRDNNGKLLPSGVYILQCDSKELTMTQKLVIEK
jgi:hypothetical protein